MEHVLWNIFYERGHKYFSVFIMNQGSTVHIYGPKPVKFIRNESGPIYNKRFRGKIGWQDRGAFNNIGSIRDPRTACWILVTN